MRPSAWRAAWAVYKNELRLLAVSWLGAVFLSAFWGLGGLFFLVGIGTTGEASLRPAVGNLAITLLFLVPMVTMRQLADEARSGTLELALTAPVSSPALLVGKWAAVVSLVGVGIAGSAPWLAVLWRFGEPDLGLAVAHLLGLWLVGGLCAAAGLFASSLTTESMVAGVLAVVLLLPTWLASAGRAVAPAVAQPWLDRVAVLERLRTLAIGGIDSGDLVWFACATLGWLFLAWRVLESRRWS
jgi:ABC-2 type transport system permease protein